MTDRASEQGLDAFLARYHRDEDEGTVRSLAEYQALFPHAHDAIARGFPELASGHRGPRRPERVGPYELLDRLGGGGQGEVYRARDTRASREVAVKLLSCRSALLDSTAAARFRREAEIASRLRHPAICPVFDLETDGDPPYLVMPLLRGETLQDLLSRAARHRSSAPIDLAPTSEEEGDSSRSPATAHLHRVLRCFEKIARALHVAHEAGIVHRDVKPGNLFVQEDGEPVVLDLGLAQDLDSEAVALTQTGQRLGTVPYMSPEQLRAEPLDRRTDVFSLGATLYEVLTGRRAFTGANEHAVQHAILHSDPPDPRRFEPSMPRDLAIVVAAALEKDVDRRYPTALDFAEDLRAVRTLRPIRARPAGPAVRLARWARRNPALATALGTTLLALCIGLVVTLELLSQRTAALTEKSAALASLEREQLRRRIALDELTLGALPDQADALWPATEELVTAARGMDHWLGTARALEARRPEYAAMLEEMRASGRGRPASRDPRVAFGRARVAEQVAGYESALDHVRRTKPDSAWVPLLEQRIGALHTLLAKERLEFDDPDDTRRYDALTALVEGIPKLAPVIASIEARREFASSVKRRTVDEHAADWRRAVAAVAADPRFGGFVLAPIVGLVPIGADGQSGFQEFAHLETGAVAERDADGKLAIGDDTGLVFVLLPGGTFRMGARPPESGEPLDTPNVDPLATPVEAPVHAVTLAPFLLSKYPMTQGQWQRAAGDNPSQNKAGSIIGGRTITLHNPVESVTWDRAREVLGHLRLDLPTEAQWEYAARGGTTTPWWTGVEKQSVAGAGNIADAYAESLPGQSTWQYQDWMNDDHFVHSPVGIYRANPFGLHDVIGNVYEWCRDGFSFYADADARPGDGLRGRTLLDARVARGAGYSSPAAAHRSAARARFAPTMRVYYLGMRPVMALR